MQVDKNSTNARLVRIESRLTQLGRWMGADLRRRPAPNAPDAPAFVDEGTVYVTPRCTIGELSVAVRRIAWPEESTAVPVVLNGIEIGTINPHIGVDRDDYADD